MVVLRSTIDEFLLETTWSEVTKVLIMLGSSMFICSEEGIENF